MVRRSPAWPPQATLTEVTTRIRARVFDIASPSPRSQLRSKFTRLSGSEFFAPGGTGPTRRGRVYQPARSGDSHQRLGHHAWLRAVGRSSALEWSPCAPAH